MNKIFASLLLALIGTITLSACNTVQGIGRDVQKAGTAVENVGKK